MTSVWVEVGVDGENSGPQVLHKIVMYFSVQWHQSAFQVSRQHLRGSTGVCNPLIVWVINHKHMRIYHVLIHWDHRDTLSCHCKEIDGPIIADLCNFILKRTLTALSDANMVHTMGLWTNFTAPKMANIKPLVKISSYLKCVLFYIQPTIPLYWSAYRLLRTTFSYIISRLDLRNQPGRALSRRSWSLHTNRWRPFLWSWWRFHLL